ncbi:uncharacterized protein LOC114191492 [Vigna unguiculata]|uniref:uncharacterized protein LOC114191492 n=1 Tax=Vigna unguiculata TaxID=3917 RepID=UPI001015DBCA|nr:uncharacterized protein LOC114191492 [Vigna unguiculata]
MWSKESNSWCLKFNITRPEKLYVPCYLIGSRDRLHILRSIMGTVNKALHCRDNMSPYLDREFVLPRMKVNNRTILKMFRGLMRQAIKEINDETMDGVTCCCPPCLILILVFLRPFFHALIL